jgi:Holliday junction resolvasome RuvABC endonuclease subunit
LIALGIDPSLTGLGWCVINTDVTGPARVIGRGVFKTTSKQIFVWRNMYLREAISKVLELYPEVQAVGSESPPYGEQFSEGLYGLFVFINEAVYRHRKDVVYFDPSQVKMLAKMDPKVRRGSMDKGDMIDAARSETGIKAWDHNEADAYLVARSAAGFWDFHAGNLKEEDLVPSEYQAYARIRTVKKNGREVEQRDGAIYKEGARFFQFSKIPSDSRIEVQLIRS